MRLLETSQRPPADLARELGVRRNQLYKWKEQTESAWRRELSLDQDEDRAATMRWLDCARSWSRVKEERDILKKAAAYFAKELK